MHAFNLLILSTGALADCSRQFLQNATDIYIAAQSAGKASGVAALAVDNLTYTENAKTLSITSGIIAQPIKIDFSRSAHDTVQCATFTELIAATNPHPYVIHTRMVLDPTVKKAVLIESIVTDKGDWLFDANGTLTLNSPENWSPIPQEQQDSRAVIQAAGDAYFNRFSNASVSVPWGPPCYRVEGGLAARGTLNGTDCVMVWPDDIVIPYRRYVIDETLGIVDIFLGFPGLDRTQGNAPMPDSHVFRVEKGKITYLHTASACVVEGCGLNGTFGRRSDAQWYRSGQIRRNVLRYH